MATWRLYLSSPLGPNGESYVDIDESVAEHLRRTMPENEGNFVSVQTRATKAGAAERVLLIATHSITALERLS